MNSPTWIRNGLSGLFNLRKVQKKRPHNYCPHLETMEERVVPAGFVAGSIQGQDGWTGGTVAISPSIVQGVDQTGTLAHTGVGAWTISNNSPAPNGAFSSWPFGPGLSVTAGQPSSGAGADRFSATYYFRTVNTVADGSNIEVDLGNSTGDDRTTFMAITNKADADGGLQIRMAEPNPADPGNDFFFPTQIAASGLTRGTWHRIDIVATFSNGTFNDTFQVSLDGTPLTNNTPGSPNNGTSNWGTFEAYNAAHSGPYNQSNRLFFRSGAAPDGYGSFSPTGAQGFAFDDISYKDWNSALPSTILASYSATFEAVGSVTTSYVNASWSSVAFGDDPDGPGGPATAMGYDAFATIQDAVNGTAAGGTVNVAAGTYAENVTINKKLTLNGAQHGVDARGTRGAESIVDGTTNGGKTPFYVTANDVTIDGFTVQGATNNSVFGFGILLGAGTSGSHVLNNIIQNNIVGVSLANASGGNQAVIQYNWFANNNAPGSASGTGIYTDQFNAGGTLSNVLIDSNKFTGHDDAGLDFSSTDATKPATLITISNNVFDGNGRGMLAFNLTNSAITSNTFQNSTSNATADIRLFEGVNNLTITGNLLKDGAGRALRISNLATGSPNATNIKFNLNSVSGYAVTPFDVADYTGTLDATKNWWGAVSGPTIASNPGGLGQAISDPGAQVTYRPWLVYGTDAAPSVAGFQLPTTITVTAGGDISAADNDYTRLANAIGSIQSGQTLILSGTFDWTKPFAAAAWAKGVDGIAGNADDYEIVVPANVNGVTVTAASLGSARIQGPGDLPLVNLEGVFDFEGGDNQNWTISNLEIFDFDLSIGMFNGAGGSDAYNGTTITNNRIRVPKDLNATVAPADVNQNIGIHYSFGTNQTISNNQIELVASGVSDSANSNFSTVVGMQSNTSGGSTYDGLLITGNIITITGAQAADPANVLGIWENGHAHTSNITVSNNQVLNQTTGGTPATNLIRAFRVTSHSSATTTVSYTGNTVSGANIGFQWIAGSNFTGNNAVKLSGNTITNSATGVLIQSNGIADFFNNSFSGNGIAIDVNGGGSASIVANTIVANGTGIRAINGGSITTLTNNFITGQTTALGAGKGIDITASAGAISAIFENKLSENQGFAINNASAAAITATANWFGSSLPTVVTSKVNGNVNVTPWLNFGNDTSAAPGFQGDFSVSLVPATINPGAKHGGTFLPGQAQYADVNGDGKADLIMQGLDNTFWVSMSNGLVFGAPVIAMKHGTTFSAGHAQYADVNGDGKADLIFQGNDNTFWLSLSNGATFNAPLNVLKHGGTFAVGQAQFADVSGDGKADLIFQGNDNTFWLSLSNGAGFAAPVNALKHGGTFAAGHAQFADVNSDGKKDLIFQGNDNTFWLSRATGAGFTAPVNAASFTGTFMAGQAQYADVNGDGKADLLFQKVNNSFWASLSTGTGFAAATQIASHGGTFTPGQAFFGRISSDAKADLIFQALGNDFYQSLSNGVTLDAARLVLDRPGSFTAGQAQFADVNGDGMLDLIFQDFDNSFTIAFATEP